ncbi:peptide chain release factor 2 [Candidatus Saccharibacteria bacterium]|nr:peptide chain release factor 2 [Candidatus Saccharibacteria bacterium]
MQPLKKRLADLESQFSDAFTKLGITEKQRERDALEVEMSRPELWNNPAHATEVNKRFSVVDAAVEPWLTLQTQLRDIVELMELGDESMLGEFEGQVTAMEAQLDELKKALRFTGRFDNHNVILRLSAGVGGTDAQDFTEMLERMYLRWAERSNLSAAIVERSAGEEAGVKTSVLQIEGPYAYGKLQGEHGVHRLVRLSPFNSDNLRQTSFALVEVLPQIDAPDEIQLDAKDLKIDVYRAGGHGGQSVNTTDSAVRVTHLPTNIVVAIQNERSQIQNKETALKILRSKLAQLQLEQHTSSITDLQAGESANWGSQIRNYVLHPYTLVKDTRTKYEEKDPQAVLDGKIDGFIASYLESEMGDAVQD